MARFVAGLEGEIGDMDTGMSRTTIRTSTSSPSAAKAYCATGSSRPPAIPTSAAPPATAACRSTCWAGRGIDHAGNARLHFGGFVHGGEIDVQVRGRKLQRHAVLDAGRRSPAWRSARKFRRERYSLDNDRNAELNAFVARSPAPDAFPPEREIKEVYAEVAVPLLEDAPFAKSLDLDLAGRYSDYDLFGSTTNPKVGLKWRPMESC